MDSLDHLGVVHNLRIEMDQPEEEFYLLEKLEGLQAYNDVKVVKFDVKKPTARKTTKSSKKGDKIGQLSIGPHLTTPAKGKDSSTFMGDQNVKGYEAVYSYVKEILGGFGVKGIAANELKEFIRTLELDLNESRRGKTAKFMEVALNNMAIFSVHNFCYTRALDLLKETDSRFFSIFKSMHELLNNYIRAFFESVLGLDSMVAQVKSESHAVEKEAIDHTADLLNRAELLLNDNQRLEGEFEKKRQAWDVEKKQLLRTIRDCEKENKELVERMVKLSKGMH